MKIYALETGYHFGIIYECEVIKETEKTYVVRINSITHTVKKREMSVWQYLFFVSYSECLEKLKDLLHKRIEERKKKIIQFHEDIEKYTAMITDIEKRSAV